MEVNLNKTIINADLSIFLRANCRQLTSLQIGNAQWVNEENKNKLGVLLPIMDTLETLDIEGLKMDDFDWLPHLTNRLRSINLTQTRFPRAATVKSCLQKHAGLTELRLGGNAIDQTCLEAIGSLEALCSLQLANIMLENLDLAMCVSAKMNSLEQLHLQHNYSLTDASFERMTEQWGLQLRVLNLINCRKLRNYGLLNRCARLQEFYAGKTPHLADYDLDHLASHGALKSIALTNCTGITDEGLVKVLKSCPMEHLLVSFCAGIGKDTLKTAFETKTMKTITIQGSEKISIEAFETDQLPDELNELNLNHCKNVNDECVEQLRVLLVCRETRLMKATRLCLSVQSTAVEIFDSDSYVRFVD